MSQFTDELIATASGVGRRQGIVVGEPARPTQQTWDAVHQRAKAMASGLMDAGVARGSVVGVLANDPDLIAVAAQAVWMSGASITMLHHPTGRSDPTQWARDTVATVRMVDCHLVLLGRPFDDLAAMLTMHGVKHRMVDDLDGVPIREPVPTTEDDLALLQLTSGSTAEPKAVEITHGNLMANLNAMADRARTDPSRDVFVSWLPTSHDMGMVGFLIFPMTMGFRLVKITPLDFLAKPLIWLDLITKYGGTVTSAPNFAYSMMAQRLSAVKDHRRFDLSTVRIMMSGGEPIHPKDIAEFTAAAQPFGLDPRSITAADGMAEVTVAASFDIDRGLEVDPVDAATLHSDGRAVALSAPASSHGGDGVRLLAKLGRPLPGLQARIVGDDNDVLPERTVGEIQLRGASISPGYLTVDGPLDTRNPEGWLETGDLGYLTDGQIVICGRRKDVIIMGGRNIYPVDVERAAATVEGVRANAVAAVRTDPDSDREHFAVIVESHYADDDDVVTEMKRAVAARVAAAVGARPRRVVVIPKGALPKTSSGKLRRAAASALFLQPIESCCGASDETHSGRSSPADDGTPVRSASDT